jgi:hypothetical protein
MVKSVVHSVGWTYLLLVAALSALTITAWPTVDGAVGVTSTLAASADTDDIAADGCQAVKPKLAFYEAGRVATETLTTPSNPECTTISVQNIKDPGNPEDHCATFLVGFFPSDGGDPTYTEPVDACSEGPHGPAVVLATDVPDGANYFVLYNVDYLIQSLRFRVLH